MFTQILLRLNSVKINACGADSGKNGVKNLNRAHAQNALEQQDCTGSASSAHLEPMSVCSNVGTLVDECRKRARDEGFYKSLLLAWNCTTKAMKGDYSLLKTVSASLAVCKAIREETAPAGGAGGVLATPARGASAMGATPSNWSTVQRPAAADGATGASR